jgi:hypothetical protein
MMEQLRAMCKKKLIKKMGTLPVEISDRVKENLKIVLDFEDEMREVI